MKQQITRISYHQTSKIMALLSALVSAVFFIVLVGVLLISHPEQLQQYAKLLRIAIAVLVLPVFSALIGYLATLLGCFFYNQLAKRVGGIEITLGDGKDD